MPWVSRFHDVRERHVTISPFIRYLQCRALSPVPGVIASAGLGRVGASGPVVTGRARSSMREVGKMRILIVEDDATLADAIGQALYRQEFNSDVAASGTVAVHALKHEHFDLVILDIGLPGLDGFEVLRETRAGGSQIPALILTARDGIEDRVYGLDLGADDYMVKPFALAELTARVRALVRRRIGALGARIVHGPLEIDEFGRRAWLSGEPVELSQREWTVLQALLRRVERVVSKEQLVQEIAGSNGELTLNAVEVYVSRLRTKLEPAGIHIRTVRGFGYMLESFPHGR
jgi:two-component system, OmpR family, response regulator